MPWCRLGQTFGHFQLLALYPDLRLWPAPLGTIGRNPESRNRHTPPVGSYFAELAELRRSEMFARMWMRMLRLRSPANATVTPAAQFSQVLRLYVGHRAGFKKRQSIN